MDVERLMQDLSVDQLQNIYSNLSVEMEEKKEELRQMVGRRYRDVLDASSCVRRVTQIADALAANVHDIRSVGADQPLGAQMSHYAISVIGRIAALNPLFALIDEADALTDAFVLILIESMHRTLSTEQIHRNNQLSRFIGHLSPKLIGYRLRLEDEMVCSLGLLTSNDQVANQLAAMAILKKLNAQQLLDVFIEQKLAALKCMLTNSVSLIDLIWHIRQTLECIQTVFVDDQLGAVLLAVSSTEWIPSSLERAIKDETYTFGKFVRTEIAKMRKQFKRLSLKPVEQRCLLECCNAFFHSICSSSRSAIQIRCECLESAASIIDFLTVILEAFEENWPILGDSLTIYQNFFANILIQRFQIVMNVELSKIEHDFLNKITTINSHPVALFKKRAAKFDSLLASGASQELISTIKEFDDGLKSLLENVKKYEAIGKEEDVKSLRERFSNDVFQMLKRMCSLADESNKSIDKSRLDSSLSFARVYLTLLQPSSSAISLSFSKNTERITQCAYMLCETAEKYLCIFFDKIISECVESSKLRQLVEICQDLFDFIAYIQEFEKLELPEVGVVEVPVQINRMLYGFLYEICLKTSENSIGHICTRNVRTHIGRKLGELLHSIYRQVAQLEHKIASRVALQYLFDVRFLNGILPSEEMRSLIAMFEARVDPFDLSLISAQLTRNARMAIQRHSVIFEHILLDVLISKELALTDSYTALVDIVPRINDVPRFTHIPRLSRTAESEASRGGDTLAEIGVLRKKEQHSSRHVSSVRSTPSFSSLYKISTSWFGNNN